MRAAACRYGYPVCRCGFSQSERPRQRWRLEYKPTHSLPRGGTKCRRNTSQNLLQSPPTMKLSTLTLMALATFSVAEDENAPSYICDTSEASPMVHHVEDIIRIAGDDHTGRKICYTPDPGIGCTSTQTALSGSGGGAAFTLCNGPNGLQGYRVSPNSIYLRFSNLTMLTFSILVSV